MEFWSDKISVFRPDFFLKFVILNNGNESFFPRNQFRKKGEIKGMLWQVVEWTFLLSIIWLDLRNHLPGVWGIFLKKKKFPAFMSPDLEKSRPRA